MRLFVDTGLLAFESGTSPNMLAPASNCCFSIIQFQLSPRRSTCWLLWFIFSTFSLLVILNGIQFVMLSHCLTILKYWCDVLMASQSKLLVDVKRYKAVAYTCEWNVSRISKENIKYSKNNRTRTKAIFGLPRAQYPFGCLYLMIVPILVIYTYIYIMVQSWIKYIQYYILHWLELI